MKGIKYTFTEKDLEKIKADYISGLSKKEVAKKWNIRSNSKIQEILKDVTRTTSEAQILAHKKYPESFKHSEETKNKMREKRLQFMKSNPDKTAWRQSNLSYPEKQFIKFLEEKGYSDKFLIEREKSIYPYFIDFAFTDLKIAIEIDGSQHLEKDRKERDNKKDDLLQSKGWKVIRIAENIVKTDWTTLQEIIDKCINKDITDTFIKVGIIKAPKTRQKVKRNINGLSEKQQKLRDEFDKRLPDKAILLMQIKSMPFTEVAKIYNVTDNCIRKWCKRLNLPYRKKDIKQFT